MKLLLKFLFLVTLLPTILLAQDGNNIQLSLDTLWVLLAAFLVFFMQAGFGMVEAGLTRAKNAVNILMKNTMDVGMASLGFFVFGYAIMFGAGNGLFGKLSRDKVNPFNERKPRVCSIRYRSFVVL